MNSIGVGRRFANAEANCANFSAELASVVTDEAIVQSWIGDSERMSAAGKPGVSCYDAVWDDEAPCEEGSGNSIDSVLVLGPFFRLKL